MQILRKGNDPKNSVMEGGCTKCGCLVRCVRSETRPFYDKNEFFNYIPCPECGADYLWVREVKAPEDDFVYPTLPAC